MHRQPLELEMPSMVAARNQRMGRHPIAVDGNHSTAAEESVQLVEAIDEAFATLTHRADQKSTTDIRQQTDSLAGLLAMQLQELDQQRGRLASLLEQIAKPTGVEK